MRKSSAAAVVAASFAMGLGSTGARADGDWDFSITPYAWAPWFDARLAAEQNPPINTESSSLIDLLEGFFLITGEARRDRLSLIGEFNWVDLADDFGPEIMGRQASWGLEGYMLALAAGYAVYEDNGTRIEALGGLRYWDIDVETTVLGRTLEGNEDILDGFVGARVETPVSDRWQFLAMATYGTGDSDKQIDLVAQFRWNWLDNTDLSFGYRHAELDFDQDSLLLDAKLYGPFASISFNF